jgi:hypothetical protein
MIAQPRSGRLLLSWFQIDYSVAPAGPATSPSGAAPSAPSCATPAARGRVRRASWSTTRGPATRLVLAELGLRSPAAG